MGLGRREDRNARSGRARRGGDGQDVRRAERRWRKQEGARRSSVGEEVTEEEVEGAEGGGGTASGTHNSQSSSQESRSGEPSGGEAASRFGGVKRSEEREERVAASGLPDKEATSSNTAPNSRGMVVSEDPSGRGEIPSAVGVEESGVEEVASPTLSSPSWAAISPSSEVGKETA